MQALGMIETRGLIAAVESTDAMLKAAEVTLLGKAYVGGGLVSVAVTGGVAAVRAAVETGAAAVRQLNGTLLVSQHVIPRPHEEISTLIVPIKPLGKVELDNAALVGAETIREPVIAETAAEKSIIEDSLSEEAADENPFPEALIPEKASEENTVSNDSVLKDSALGNIVADEHLKVEESSLPGMELDKINKEFIDNTMAENGLEKAIEILNGLKVSKLRSLAREYGKMRIAGRSISKADKKLLLEEFKVYYKSL